MVLAVLAVLASASVAVHGAVDANGDDSRSVSVMKLDVPRVLGDAQCCKYCNGDSKACGDGCISLNYTCHESAGCACNGTCLCLCVCVFVFVFVFVSLSLSLPPSLPPT